MDSLQIALSHQQWKAEQLHEQFRHKEDKKYQALKVSYLSLTMYATILSLSLAFLARNSSHEQYLEVFSYSSLIVTALVSIVNLVVMRLIAAIKRDSLLIISQINSVRLSMHRILYETMESKQVEWEGLSEINADLLNKDSRYFSLIGFSRKLPIDDSGLEETYFTNNRKSLRAMFKSSDLFSIILIYVFLMISVCGNVFFLFISFNIDAISFWVIISIGLYIGGPMVVGAKTIATCYLRTAHSLEKRVA
ncbi:hypothetical protein [Vibrio coralliilyticus]|uniref:hypothetical protein n=1 Tax=Vibrio coralliilyticus TaxID=190893 RepID=UPI0002E8AEC5|nr:hypothetical protein [Vibrio coralliilyticus]